MIDIFETYILQRGAYTAEAHISFTPNHLATITLYHATRLLSLAHEVTGCPESVPGVPTEFI